MARKRKDAPLVTIPAGTLKAGDVVHLGWSGPGDMLMRPEAVLNATLPDVLAHPDVRALAAEVILTGEQPSVERMEAAVKEAMEPAAKPCPILGCVLLNAHRDADHGDDHCDASGQWFNFGQAAHTYADEAEEDGAVPSAAVLDSIMGAGLTDDEWMEKPLTAEETAALGALAEGAWPDPIARPLPADLIAAIDNAGPGEVVPLPEGVAMLDVVAHVNQRAQKPLRWTRTDTASHAPNAIVSRIREGAWSVRVDDREIGVARSREEGEGKVERARG